jgi:hypothetical protein
VAVVVVHIHQRQVQAVQAAVEQAEMQAHLLTVEQEQQTEAAEAAEAVCKTFLQTQVQVATVVQVLSFLNIQTPQQSLLVLD